ncbi:MAG: mannose-1-phosphate guanylyltransferase/mannose-6-phosphate isomerase [Pacificimonas sp.]
MSKQNPQSSMIHPVILSGGSGTRLWPLSRTLRPKQMLSLGQSTSMIAATAARAVGDGFAPAIIVAGAAHERLVSEALVHSPPGTTILEPAARNTAPAIALAAHQVATKAADDLLLVMPSDHLIADVAAFHEAVIAGAALADDGWLVTFGIEPDRAETGYGYIEAGEELSARGRVAAQFREKPDLDTAKSYIATGGFYWNAGIFLMRADRYLDALAAHAADMASASRDAFTAAVREGDVLRPDAAAFQRSPSQSIDYAVMEREARKAVVPVSMGWSDIGSFEALHDVLPQDAEGNVVQGDAIVDGCQGSLVWSEGLLAAAVDLDDIALIATPDAVVALPLKRSQEVKRIVARLKDDERPETEDAPPAPGRR